MVEFIKMAAWQEIHITTSAEYADQLSTQLSLLGAQAVTLHDAGDQPIYEPSATTPSFWNETLVIGLFDHAHDMTPIMGFLKTQQSEGLLKHFHLTDVADEDWVRRSLDQFKPIRCGKRLWICPSWQLPPDPQAINVILDPGLAFGTGTHPTTALCLEWLDAHIQTENLVIDYGCGSGILGIAALKLGAKQVFAVDHDPQALTATQDNGERNQLCSPDLQTYSPEKLPDCKADLLIANILLQPLIKLSTNLVHLINPCGKIVLSGILRYLVEEILTIYGPYFTMQPPVFKEEWALIAGNRKDNI